MRVSPLLSTLLVPGWKTIREVTSTQGQELQLAGEANLHEEGQEGFAVHANAKCRRQRG